MRFRRAFALLGASAAILFTACKEPPFAPRWDADWYVPLSFQTIPVPSGAILNGASNPDSFPGGPLSQGLSGVLGTVTKNLVTDPARCSAPSNPALSCDLITVTMTKTLALTVQDTVFVGNAANVLNAAGSLTSGTIALAIGLTGAQSSQTDSVYLSPAQVAMLQALGSSQGQLYIQVRGVLSNQSGGTITTTGADAIGITSLTATIRVAVSHK